MSKVYQPTFTVITPTHNRCYILWRAVQSVLNQTYPFFELIIIDDNSRDETAKLVGQFGDPRIRYYKIHASARSARRKNMGASAARNFGLKKAKGQFIAYLDSDNAWYPEYLESMHKAFLKHKDKILIFCKKNYRLTLIEKGGREKKVRDETTYTRRYFDLKRLWHRRIIIDTNSMCHRKNEIIKLGGWDENLGFWEDWELTLRISKKFPQGFFYLNRALLDYEQKIDLSDAKNSLKLWAREEKKIFKKHQGHPLLSGQTWFPPQKGNKSTLGVIEFLKENYK
jgi:glycosyltransferase involved in cell wall biosynthesis